jgi:hypothetical protein
MFSELADSVHQTLKERKERRRISDDKKKQHSEERKNEKTKRLIDSPLIPHSDKSRSRVCDRFIFVTFLLLR